MRAEIAGTHRVARCRALVRRYQAWLDAGAIDVETSVRLLRQALAPHLPIARTGADPTLTLHALEQALTHPLANAYLANVMRRDLERVLTALEQAALAHTCVISASSSVPRLATSR